MSYWVAGAAIGSAVIGAVSSNNAANKSASAAKAGIKSTTDLANQSRLDAVNLFNQGKQSRMLGQNAAFDFYKQNAQNISQPMVQGNMMAQQVQGQGGIQANNAILGLPVDMSFANNPQQVSADYSAINTVQLPQLGTSYNVLGQAQPEQTSNSAASSGYNYTDPMSANNPFRPDNQAKLAANDALSRVKDPSKNILGGKTIKKALGGLF